MDESTAKEIKDYLTIAKPVIDPLISTFLAPKIAKLTSWIKRQDTNNKIVDNAFENKFAEYLATTYCQCQNINILIFPNQQIKQ